MQNDDCKILVCYHKQSQLIKSDILTPIHVGRDLTNENDTSKRWLFDNLIGDNTGDNISNKNGTFCELTALYWAWKNLKANYIGLFHYRRILSFKFPDLTTYTLDNGYLQKIGLSDDEINRMCEKYDIILPPIYNTHPAGYPENRMTNYDFYCKEHIKEDLDTIINIIKQDYPEYIQDANDYLNSKRTFFFNMFIMRNDLFNQYMEFLFGILNKAEKIIKISDDAYQARVFGFLSERLQNIFVYHIMRTRPEIRIFYAKSMVYYSPSLRPVKFNKKNLHLGSMKYLQDNSEVDNNEINVVFSIDNNYAKHCAATLASILLNSSKVNKFNIFILDGGLSPKIKAKFEKLKNIRDFNITYLSIDNNYFKDLPMNRSYISIATYYRLLLPEVLPKNIDKVIYLDSDIIVEDDIAKLWNYDISDKFAAVVEDEGSIYQIQRMHLPAKNSYFNAGVCMFNIKKLREIDFQNIWKNYYKDNKEIITLQDQDILNGVFNGNCLFIPLQWNTNGRLYTKDNLIEHSYTYEEACFAAHNPSIIHFTDVNKPWSKYCTHPLRGEYLKYLKLTPWKNQVFGIALNNKLFYSSVVLKQLRKKVIRISINRKEISIKLFNKKLELWKHS